MIVTEEDIDSLSNLESFARLVQTIIEDRETCIEDLKESHGSKLEKLSGAITTYDEVIFLLRKDLVRRRHPNIVG